MYRPSQTPHLTLSSEQVAQAQPTPRREPEGPSLGTRSVDNTLVRFPLHRCLRGPNMPAGGECTTLLQSTFDCAVLFLFVSCWCSFVEIAWVWDLGLGHNVLDRPTTPLVGAWVWDPM
ncbi:hypothetical protein MRX96_058767 [Rhipicephalus microplus]